MNGWNYILPGLSGGCLSRVRQVRVCYYLRGHSAATKQVCSPGWRQISTALIEEDGRQRKVVLPPGSPPLNYLPIRMKPWIACVPKCEVGAPLKVKVTLDSGRTAPPTTSIDSLHGVASEHLDIKGAALPSAVT